MRVCNIQRGCVHDGEGVRTTVFFHGCPHRCPWCCNPETLIPRQIVVDKSKCLKSLGISSELCKECGIVHNQIQLKNSKCPFSCITHSYTDYDTDSLLKILIEDSKLFKFTGGGITLSGGEPLVHARELVDLCLELKNRGINIAIETTLYKVDGCALISPYIDEYIVDLKLQPSMYLDDPEYLPTVKNEIENIPDFAKIKYRMVFTPDIISRKFDILSGLVSLNVRQIELLQCHNLAESKYKTYGINFSHSEFKIERLKEFESLLKSQNINVVKCKI